ncbi:hypothetical protein ACFSZS_31430 [Seohaeicola zhoushanensis]
MGDNMRALLALSLTSPEVAKPTPTPRLSWCPSIPGSNTPLVIW